MSRWSMDGLHQNERPPKMYKNIHISNSVNKQYVIRYGGKDGIPAKAALGTNSASWKEDVQAHTKGRGQTWKQPS